MKNNNKDNIMKRNFSKEKISATLIPLLAVSFFVTSPISAYAKNKTVTVNNGIVNTNPDSEQENNNVSPDTPITFNVGLNDDVLKALHLTYEDGVLSEADSSHFGVLITDGDNFYISTTENNLLTYETDGTNITITANHEELKRYTKYTAYLLTGDSLNKAQSVINSNGHSNAFKNFIQKNEDSLKDITFDTGSEVGEASKWTAVIDDENPTVLDDATIELSATDDYGNDATEGSVKVINVKTTDNTVISDTFSITNNVALENGKAEIAMSNHKAQSVEVTVQTVGKYAEDIKTFTLNASFLPGTPHSAIVNVDKDSVVVGKTLNVSGSVKDLYDNAVLPSDLEFSIGDETTTVTTGDSGSFNTEITAPTVIDQSNGLIANLDVSVKSKDGDLESNKTIAVKPDVAKTISLNNEGKIYAGSSVKLKGQVKDQYGNLALPSSINLTSNAGTIDRSITSDNTGSFEVNFVAPQVIPGNLSIQSSLSTGEVLVLDEVPTISPLQTSAVTISSGSTSAEAGKPMTITGTAKDMYGNNVEDGTEISIKNGTTVIATAQTVKGVYTATVTPTTSEPLVLTAGTGTVTSTPITVSSTANYNVTVNLRSIYGSSTQTDAYYSLYINGTAKDANGVNAPDGTVVTIKKGSTVIATAKTSGGTYTTQWIPTGGDVGTASITATVGTNVSPVSTITVNALKPASMSIDIGGIGWVGSTFTVSGYVYDSHGQSRSFPTPVTVRINGNSYTTYTTSSGYYSYRYNITQAGTYTCSASIGGVTSSTRSITCRKI